jgi:hypothetical protein
MKSIIVEEATHGWILDNKTSKKKSADAVIWGLIEENHSLTKKINALKKQISEQN